VQASRGWACATAIWYTWPAEPCPRSRVYRNSDIGKRRHVAPRAAVRPSTDGTFAIALDAHPSRTRVPASHGTLGRDTAVTGHFPKDALRKLQCLDVAPNIGKGNRE
jgi:hypothetical protein